MTKGAMNESQLKFLKGTWPMSQTQSDSHLFYLGQDNIAIDELLVLGTGLGIVAETQIDTGKNTCKTDDKNWTKTQFMFSQAFHQTPYKYVRETII
jgi:hypothetical protein